ncbi:MAG: hypothetical protein DI636_07860 [Pelagerythrobacter marensis]|nr:MAG: hypothetical protein DI636_07860 [Pelagerythrobacter marensis]
MPIRFAPAIHCGGRSPVHRVLSSDTRAPAAANDNAPDALFDAVQQNALRLFGAHGVAAVSHFAAAAKAALAAGNRNAAMRYLAYCAALDPAKARRLASDLGTG